MSTATKMSPNTKSCLLCKAILHDNENQLL